MSLFQDWLKNRRISEGLGDSTDPSDAFRMGQDDEDYAHDQERTEKELFKVILSKYPNETMGFLEGLAQRGDEEVAALLRKMKKQGPRQSQEPRHSSEEDQVVPSMADRGHNDFGD